MEPEHTDLDAASDLLTAGPLVVREDGSEARFGTSELRLTHAQRLVLAALVRRAGRVGRRWELYEEAFGRPLPPGSRAVDLHVTRIRNSLGPVGQCIVSIDRVGYRLDMDLLAWLAGSSRLRESFEPGNAGVTPPSPETDC